MDQEKYATAHFTEHLIVDRVLTPTLGSWLIRSPKGSEFWCRITAADRLLVVVGDFEPTVFAYGDKDPRSCVAWMGKGASGGYACEKASIGMGHNAIYSYDVDDMVEDLEGHISEALGPKDQWIYLLDVDDETGEDLPIRKNGQNGEEIDDPMFIKACLAGLRAATMNSPDGVRNAMVEVDHSAIDILGSLGRRVQQRVFLALAAIARLEHLLEAEELI